MRVDCIVPVAMKLAGCDVDRLIVGVGNLDPLLVVCLIQCRVDFKASCRARGANQGDDHLVALQRFATPGASDMAKQTMLDLVPLAGAGWKVAYLHLYTEFVREFLQFVFPEPTARSIAPSAVGRNEDSSKVCLWVTSPS